MEIKKRKNIILFGAIFILMVLFLTISPTTAEATNLRLSPSTGKFLVGSTFDLSIVLDTKDVPINFTEVELFFPSDKLQVISPSAKKSIIKFWPTSPEFSNQDGRLYLAGGSPDPGINTSEGVVLAFVFRVISAGEAEVRFGDKTSVLAHDGKGTETLDQTSSAFFQFSSPPPSGPTISSSTHPEQDRWYKDNNPTFVWSKGDNTEAYSFHIDRDPTGIPNMIADSTEATASFTNLENGIWYFHLREKAHEVWGGTSHYVIKIDNQPPASFNINISPARETTNSRPIFRFFTTDLLSGFSHFEMKIIPLSSAKTAEALFFKINSPYQTTELKPGRYQVVVRAFDKVGNINDETTIINIASPFFAFVDPHGIDLIFIFAPWLWIVLFGSIVFVIFLLVGLRLYFKNRLYVKYVLRKDFRGILSIFKKNSKTKNKI